MTDWQSEMRPDERKEYAAWGRDLENGIYMQRRANRERDLIRRRTQARIRRRTVNQCKPILGEVS